jgi:hypothetical protein
MSIQAQTPQQNNDFLKQIEQLQKEINQQKSKPPIDVNKEFKEQKKKRKAKTEQHEA